MLKSVQVIQDEGKTKFAVLPFAVFEEIRVLLSDEEKLVDYLDYLHMQRIREQSPARLSLAEVKASLERD